MLIRFFEKRPKFMVYQFLAIFLILLAFFGYIKTNAQSNTPTPVTPPNPDEERNSSSFQINNDLRNKMNSLGSSPASNIRIPILLNVSLRDIYDTWGDARANGRTHEGTDILSPRGAFIVSPVDAVVGRTGYGSNGGNYVYTYTAGGERYYYAHLDAIPKNIQSGQILKTGDLIGYVGNTGNAAGGPTHLHFGIYARGTAINPFPRLTLEFSLAEKIDSLNRILNGSDDAHALAQKLIIEEKNLFLEAQKSNIALPSMILKVFEEAKVVGQIALLKKEMPFGSSGTNVKLLQEFLIKTAVGPYGRLLTRTGITGYFGSLTKSALAEYQTAVVIVPSSGNFGPLTREHFIYLLTNGSIKLNTSILNSTVSSTTTSTSLNRDLEIGAEGNDVKLLQELLIKANRGPAAILLSKSGATGYFGSLTKTALIEYQKAYGIPTTGYFGPITRARLQ